MLTMVSNQTMGGKCKPPRPKRLLTILTDCIRCTVPEPEYNIEKTNDTRLREMCRHVWHISLRLTFLHFYPAYSALYLVPGKQHGDGALVFLNCIA